MSEAPPGTQESILGTGFTLLSLCFAAGSTDVLSFVEFGGVFTSAMTGNTALLAIAVGRGHILAAAHSSTALLAFIIGVALAEAVIRSRRAPADPRGRLRWLLLAELGCLCASAALWTATRGFAGAALYAVIVLSALGMGIQGVAARLINASGINTIVFTTVLIRVITSLADRIARRPYETPASSAAPHLPAFAAYALGGLAAGVLSSVGESLLAWVPVLAVIAALAWSWRER